ncbi:hypothetical protein [Actinomadura parmotrematis]|uniref:DUF3159 domain-containing protein n=1 Tax=Actinomadura parmotrematis TaxID=2864039 RepID=A0ABS7G5M2_9ACTN|nr:hypothetical protein [Actinomadura parmotrematis]MBW8487530.1 hypothetical protein [Actinomadura parmotrematis]
MNYVLTFLPWIVYAVLPSGQWQWAALAGLAVALGVIVRQRAAGAGPDALVIEIGSAAFFAVLAAIAFADPHSPVHPYSPALSSGVLAVIAGASLAARRPFTLGIAKRSTPREFWDQPLFVRTNVVLTAVWTAAFAVTAAILAALAHAGQGHSAAAVAVQVAGFVLPIAFTLRYVAAVQARAQRLAAGGS